MGTFDEHGPRIVVLGAGIGGLTAAAFLHRAGLQATVYEQAGELREVGAGIQLPPNAVRLLRHLGRVNAVRERAVPLRTAWRFHRWHDGRVISQERLDGRCEELYGEQMYTVHRADLLDVVRSAVPSAWLRLGRRCVHVAPRSDDVVLTFDDGTTVEADVVVGADGVHSLVRDTVAAPSAPEPSGLCAFRALVPADEAPAFAREPVMNLWLGPGRHLVHYPVSGGDLVNIVAVAPARGTTDDSWSATTGVDELRAEFAGWDADLQRLVDAAGTPGRWALLDRPPLDRWAAGRLVLLGDAAHPMYPFLAQGAAQAMEDGAALARCLADGSDDVVTSLERYERIRLPRATRIQRLSRDRAAMNHLPDGEPQRRRDADLARGSLLDTNGWLYAYDADRAAGHAA